LAPQTEMLCLWVCRKTLDVLHTVLGVHVLKLLTDTVCIAAESVTNEWHTYPSRITYRETCSGLFCHDQSCLHCVFSMRRAHWWAPRWYGGGEAAASATLERLTDGRDRPLETEVW